MPDRRNLRVIHTSDVHLGAYEGGNDEKWSDRRALIEQAFTRVIDAGNDESADVLLIAGDFFDNDRVRTETVEFAAREIARFRGKAYLIPGNHDPMDPGSIYWRHDLEALAPNLRIFRDHGGQFMVDEELDSVLWGRAYIDTDWHFRPLDGLPRRLDDRWHVALGHGHFVRANGEMHRSLLIPESAIAGMAAEWDYFAFGHWEPHADVSTGGATAIYSGAPMPLSDANKKAGWAAIVDLDESGVRWRLVRVDPRDNPG